MFLCTFDYNKGILKKCDVFFLKYYFSLYLVITWKQVEVCRTHDNRNIFQIWFDWPSFCSTLNYSSQRNVLN